MIIKLISIVTFVIIGSFIDTHPLVDPPNWNPSWPMFENGTYQK